MEKKNQGKEQKKKTRMSKNLFGRILAALLAVILVMTSSAFEELEIVTRAAEDGSGTEADGSAEGDGTSQDAGEKGINWSIQVLINETKIEEVKSISQGDKLYVDVKGTLDDDWIYENGDYVKVIDLNTLENVKIPEVSDFPLDVNGSVVGKANVKDNKITITLTNADNFLTGKNGREVTAHIEGDISGISDDIKNGKQISITVQGKTWTLYGDNGEGELDLYTSKNLGEFKMNSDGTGKQYYTVTVKGGWVNSDSLQTVLTSIVDTNGSGLSDEIYDLKILDNTTTGNGDKFAKDSSLSSLAELEGAVFKRNESITVSYYKTVTSSAVASYLQTGNGSSELENTATVNYKTNKENDKTATSTVNKIEAKRIQVSKVADSESSSDAQQVWTITIDVGDAYKSSQPNLSAYVTSITDEPQSGLLGEDTADLKLSSFTGDGKGKFTATVKTTLASSLTAAESTTVKNKVTVVTNDQGEISKEGSYTTSGTEGATIVKEATKYESDSKTITWTITIKNLSSTSTKVKILDSIPSYVGSTDGKHALLNTIAVDSVTVIKDGKIINSDVVQSAEIYDQWMQITLQDAYIQKLNGDLTVTVQSQIDSSVASLKNRQFYNDAALYYLTEQGDTKDKAYKNALYENTDEDGDVLSKDGAVNKDNQYRIDYTLTLDTGSMTYDAAAGEIVITDELPEGLTFVAGSEKATDYVSRYSGSWSDSALGYYKKNDDGYVFQTYSWNDGYTAVPVSSVTAAYNSAKRIITFKLSAGSDLQIRQLAAVALGGTAQTKITYSAVIADEAAFSAAGQKVTYTNKANGTYGSKDLNSTPAISNVVVSPEQLVTKNGESTESQINGATYKLIHYTVDINPNARTLLDGGKLTGTDTLGSALSYYLDSVKVTAIDADGNETVLKQGDGEKQYSFAYDDADNTLTFSLPDGMHLVIEYDAMINVFKGNSSSESGVLNAANATNQFELSGTGLSNTKDSDVQTLVNTSSNFSVTYGKGAITIKKYWTDGGQMKAVIGTVFEVYKMELVDGNYEKRKLAADNIKIMDGTVKIDDLDYNTVYGLYEVEPGTPADSDSAKALALRSEPYLFVIPGSASYTAPDGVRQFATGNYLYYENKESESAVMTISKEDTSGKAVAGATLTLYNADKTEKIASWTTEQTAKNINVVESGTSGETDGKITLVAGGTYVLEETDVPVGYLRASDIQFTVTMKGTEAEVQIISGTGKVSGVKLTMTDEKVPDLKVNKISAGTDGNGLSGAQFTLYDVTDLTYLENLPETAKVETWTSNGTEHTISGSKLKIGGSYILVEDSAPLGYSKLETKIKFTVTDTGEVKLVESNSAELISLNQNLLTIKNKELPTIKISKKAVDSSTELSGAQLALYVDRDDLEDSSNKDNVGSIATWTSSNSEKEFMFDVSLAEGEVRQENGTVILAPGKYVLTETAAPTGYVQAEPVYFQIASDGTLQALDKDGNVKNTEQGQNGEVDNDTITMRDAKYVDLYVKKGAQGFRADVEGAKLAVFAYADIEKNNLMNAASVSSAMKKGTIKAVAEWTSSSKTDAVKNKLLPNVEYVLVELEKPEYFEALDSLFVFTIDADGKVSWKNGQTPSADEAKIENYGTGTDNQITLLDKYTDTSIRISKWGFDNLVTNYEKKQLAGAEFSLYRENKKDNIFTWISSDEAAQEIKVSSTESLTAGSVSILPNTTYVLEEKSAPAADSNGTFLILEKEIKFQVGIDGTIQLVGTYLKEAVEISENGKELKVWNEHQPGETRIAISKQDKNSGAVLDGATLRIYEASENGEMYSYNADASYVEWESNTLAQSFVIPNDATKAVLTEKQLKLNTVYALVEEKAPDGYQVAEAPIYFRVVEDGSSTAATDTSNNAKKSVKIEVLSKDTESCVVSSSGLILSLLDKPYLPLEVAKVDSETGEMLSGATLAIYRAADLKISSDDMSADLNLSGITAVYSWQSSGEVKTITDKLVDGVNYVLVETSAPEGYEQITSSILFELDADGKVKLLTGSDSTGSGLVEVMTGSTDADNQIVLKNKFAEKTVKISKKEINDTDELKGATLILKNETGNEIARWESGESAKEITIASKEEITKNGVYADSIKITPGTYTLQEVQAPETYAVAEEITFAVDKLGEITIKNGEGDKNLPKDEDGNAILTMFDEKLQNIYVSKVNMAGNALSGASLAVYKKSDLGNITKASEITADVTAVLSWVSKGTAQEISGLIPGTEYALVETKAPDKYEKTDIIYTFKVSSDGKIEITGSNENLTLSKHSNEDDQLNLTNEISGTTITVSKKEIANGPELPGASLFLYQGDNSTGTVLAKWKSASDAKKIKIGSTVVVNDIADETVSLQITPGTYTLKEEIAPKGYSIASEITFFVDEAGQVKVLSGDGVADKNQLTMIDKTIELKISKKSSEGAFLSGALFKLYEYTNGEKGSMVKEWVTMTSEYQIPSQLLTVGTKYLLEETTAPSGYEKYEGSIVFTIQKNGSISLEKEDGDNYSLDGNTITVFNKEESKLGTLILTKTIEGADAGEEAVKNLKFVIENTNTNEKKEVSLSDFTLESEKYVYRWEQIAVGSYTVTEICEEIDGKTLAVTYQIDSNEEKQGKATSAFGVSSGATKTVAYKNVYTATSSPSPTPTEPTKETTETPSPTVTENPSATPSATPSDSPSATPSASPSATPSASPEASASASATATAKPSKTPSSKKTPENTATPTPDAPTVTTTATPAVTKTIAISKKAIGGSEEVPGATLAIYEGGDTSGTPLCSWISGTTERKIGVGDKTVIDGSSIVLAPGRYTLKETGAPAGYSYTEEIPFRITSDGKLERVTSVGEISQDGTTLTVRDGVIQLYVSKVDLISGEEVPGATISLYRKAEAGNEGRTALETWVSTENSHLIETKLQAGADYALIEEVAPDGYNILETVIFFHVNEDGTVSFTESYSDLETELDLSEDGTYSIILLKDNLLDTITESSSTTTGSQVKTGDNSHLALWIVLMLAGIGIIITALSALRRKKEQDR